MPCKHVSSLRSFHAAVAVFLALGLGRLSAIGVNSTQGLSFGAIVTDSAGGTVVISAAASATRTRGTGNLVLVGSSFRAASFRITGTANESYVVTIPSSPVQLVGPTGSSPMSVGSFTHSLSSLDGSLDAGGTAVDCHIGATLTVGANQMPGSYSGTFEVTVAND